VLRGSASRGLDEPIYDILGKIVYAENNPMAYHAFGRAIPWFLVLGYLPWVGLAPYLVFKAMQAGVTRRTLHIAAATLFVSVACVEIFGNSLRLWTYYGEPPMKYLGVAASSGYLPVGRRIPSLCVCQRTERLASRADRLHYLGNDPSDRYAATSWPGYFALYADLPPVLDWVASAALLAMCAAMAAGLLTWRNAGVSLSTRTVWLLPASRFRSDRLCSVLRCRCPLTAGPLGKNSS